MKTMYIECAMGAAGDMLMAALLDMIPDSDAFIEQMNSLGLPGVHLHQQSAMKCGITGRSVSVHVHGEEEESHDVLPHEHGHEHNHTPHNHHAHHHHSGVEDIGGLIDGLDISDNAKRHAKAVYNLIAEAESHAHGVPVTQIHFHEVGTMDAVADVVGVCLLMEMLGPDRVIVSPIHVGSGQVRCAHGVLPVPAPATAHILRGVPTYGGYIRGELCTPTGAALLKHYATTFGSMPVMAVDSIGYGMGKKDFPAANCVRIMLGTDGAQDGPNGEVALLSCNLDDTTGEALGFAQETLLDMGALDVYSIPIQMKKNRPGQMFCCICRPEDADRMAKAMLEHTSSFGVRRETLPRYTLAPTISEAPTRYGTVRIKTGTGYGLVKSKPEYEDLRTAAQQHDVSIETVRGELFKG